MAKAFLYVIGAIAIIRNFVQADYKQEYLEYSKNLCVSRLDECRQQLATGYISVPLNASIADLNGICDGKPRSNRPTECMMACEMQLKGWMDEKGLFQKSGYIEYMESLPHKADAKYWEVVEYVADSCNANGSEDKCQTALVVLKCLEDEGRKFGYDGFGLHYLTYIVSVYI